MPRADPLSCCKQMNKISKITVCPAPFLPEFPKVKLPAQEWARCVVRQREVLSLSWEGWLPAFRSLEAFPGAFSGAAVRKLPGGAAAQHGEPGQGSQAHFCVRSLLAPRLNKKRKALVTARLKANNNPAVAQTGLLRTMPTILGPRKE